MTIVIKPAARTDILRQVGYYGDLERPDVALRFLQAVQGSIDHLVPVPFAGSPKHFDHSALQGLRTWPVKGFEDFRIYYLVKGDDLTILRILHGRRDIAAILEDYDDHEH